MNKGLLIKEPWISYILQQQKTWEIRRSHSHIRGTVGLIKSGSGLILGSAQLVDSFPLTEILYTLNIHKHRIEHLSFDELPYKNPHVWVFDKATIFDNPIPYTHKKGAVIWVNLDEKTQ